MEKINMDCKQKKFRLKFSRRANREVAYLKTEITAVTSNN